MLHRSSSQLGSEATTGREGYTKGYVLRALCVVEIELSLYKPLRSVLENALFMTFEYEIRRYLARLFLLLMSATLFAQTPEAPQPSAQTPAPVQSQAAAPAPAGTIR